jgi:type IV pilus assembly protein PilM
LQRERFSNFLSMTGGVLQLKRQRKPGATVGLEFEAGGIVAAEVDGASGLTATALQPLAPGAFHEGEVVDSELLVGALKELYASNKLSKRVRIGIGNQRVVVRTVRLPAIEDPKEMDAAVRFQAQEQMPMPLDQAVLEHQIVGGVPAEEGALPQVDVVVVAARRDMVISFVDALRRAGLEPAGIDLAAFGMIRALAGTLPDSNPAGFAEDGTPIAANEAILYCSLGDIMNLAVARGRSCLFTRTSMVGLEAIAGRLSAEAGLSPEHATQWLAYVGLGRALEGIEGDPAVVAAARRALEEGVGALFDEVRLSLDYYAAQEGAVPVGRVVLCGPGSAVPGLVEAMEAAVGIPMVAARPPAFAAYADDAAARLTLAYGLALEN